MSGFFRVHRSVLGHPVLDGPHGLAGAWVVLLGRAEWPKGSVRTTWDALAGALGWNTISAKRWINRLEKAGMISSVTERHRLVLTILDRTTFSVEGCEGNGAGEITAGSATSFGKAKPVLGYGREPIPASIRREVFERDGEVCAYCCGIEGPFELDHIVPVAAGGGNEAANLTVACKPCNRSKSATPLIEWRAL